MTAAVVFDLGGVLVDWDPRHLYRKLIDDDAAMEHFLATVCTHEWNEQHDRGRPFGENAAALKDMFPQHADLIDAYGQRWSEMVAGAIDGTVEVVRELHAQGTPVYVLSNIWAESVTIVRERFDWLDLFVGGIFSGEERMAKPDAEIFQLLCDRYGLEPAATVFVDDVSANVDAARRLGFDAFQFSSPAQLRAELAARGLLLDGQVAQEATP